MKNTSRPIDPDFELVKIAQHPEDVSLLEAEEAFISLYNKYFPSVYGFFYHKTASLADSEDLTSETFSQAIPALKNFQARSSFKNWLFGIAKVVFIKYLQTKYRNPLLSEEHLQDEIISPDILADFHLSPEKQDYQNAIIEKDNLTLLNKILLRLPSKYRQVLEHRFLKNMSVQETASALNLSEQNVKIIQHRALKKANSLNY